VVNAVNDSIHFIKTHAINVADVVGSILFPQGGSGVSLQNEDACKATCSIRININGQTQDFYFDQPNGCITKGFLDPTLDIFNSCCDKHSQCLNAKCCTNDCQALKNECDAEFEKCNKEVCLPLFHDNLQFYPCLARGAYIASSAVNRTCNSNSIKNRKLCYCHLNI